LRQRPVVSANCGTVCVHQGRYLEQDGFMKRQRGRGRKPGGGGNQGNRPFESSGPDVKIRGTAAQIYEKYSQYARDAQSSGDRVKYESYLQHAEHYFRIMAATMPREQRMQQLSGEGGHMNNADDRDGDSQDGSKSDDSGENGYEDAAESNESEAAAEESEERDEEETEASGQDERGEGQTRGRRRRGRRRPNDGDRQGGPAAERTGGERNGGERAAGGDTEARSALDSLARRQGALTGG
jgi:hypothetical protein